jgi:hypothetical protein
MGCDALGCLLDGDRMSARVPEGSSGVPDPGMELVGRQGGRLRSESCRNVIQVGEHSQTFIHGVNALILAGHRVEVEVSEVWIECPEHGFRRWLQAVHARLEAAVANGPVAGREGVLVADGAELLQPLSHPTAVHGRNRSVA